MMSKPNDYPSTHAASSLDVSAKPGERLTNLAERFDYARMLLEEMCEEEQKRSVEALGTATETTALAYLTKALAHFEKADEYLDSAKSAFDRRARIAEGLSQLHD